MSAIQQAIIASGGQQPPTVTFDYVSLTTANEGDTIYVYYDYSNFNGQPVYWSIAFDPNTCSQYNFTSDTYGSQQHFGSGTNLFQIHPKANHVTTGNWHYSINLGSTLYGTEYGTFGVFTVNDTSTTPNTSLVFDIDPANITSTTMTLGAPFNCPDTGGFSLIGQGYWFSKSASYGGTMALNGDGQWLLMPDLIYSSYQSVSVSAWINITAVGQTQTIVAKELVYKLRVNSDGSLSWGVSSNGGSWTYTAVTSAGAITAGSWYHVAATVDVSHTTLYINGQQAAQTTGLSLAKNTNPFVIGAYGNSGGMHDYFAGLMGEVKMWNYALADSDITTEYNNTFIRYNPPVSLVFNQPEEDYLMVPASNDWNLGTTYTIEFWMKANHRSLDGVHIPGGQWGLINQTGWYGGMQANSMLIGLSNGFLTVAQDPNNDIGFAEPEIGGVPTTVFNVSSPGGWNGSGNWTNLTTTGGTGKGLIVSVTGASGGYATTVAIVAPGSGYTTGDVITAVGESTVSFIIGSCTPPLWTHVAVVNNGGGSSQKVYYNGVEQTKVAGTYESNGWTNSTADLYIGRLAPNYSSHFDGKLAMIRISNTAKYTSGFTPSLNYGVEADTKLFLSKRNPLVDSKSHTVNNNGVTTSTVFPVAQSFSLTAPPSDGRYLPWTDNSSGVTADIQITSGSGWGGDSSHGGGIVWTNTNHGYITLGYTNPSTSFTLSFAADFEPEAGHWNVLFGDYYSNGPFAYANNDGNGTVIITAGVGSNTTVQVPNSAVVTGLAWWDFVYSGTNLTIYKNGTQVATGTLNFATSLSDPLRIGSRPGTNGDYLVGTLWQIKYQSTALDSSGITAQYNAVKSTYGLT